MPSPASSCESRPPRGALRWIQAGWSLIVAGFFLAFICAVALSNEPRSTEKLFSDLHRTSMYIMLGGLICLAIGYRWLHYFRRHEYLVRKIQERSLDSTPPHPAAEQPPPAPLDATEIPQSENGSGISLTQWTAVTADSHRLQGRTWEPEDSSRGTVLIVHGLSDHISRYADFAAFLCQRGYRVVGYDQRGHGRSSGIRGHAPAFQRLLLDVLQIWNEHVQVHTGPHFLYGHSLGGCEVLNLAMRPPQTAPAIDGLIASSPLLLPAHAISPWKERVGRLANHVFPWLPFSTDIDPSELTHDSRVIHQLRHDPYWHRRVTARLGVEMLAAGEWALDHAEQLRVPTLMLHGDEDSLTSLDACRRFAERNPRYCRLVEFPGMRHELHHETDRDRVWKTIADWLDEQAASAESAPSQSLEKMQ